MQVEPRVHGPWRGRGGLSNFDALYLVVLQASHSLGAALRLQGTNATRVRIATKMHTAQMIGSIYTPRPWGA